MVDSVRNLFRFVHFLMPLVLYYVRAHQQRSPLHPFSCSIYTGENRLRLSVLPWCAVTFDR